MSISALPAAAFTVLEVTGRDATNFLQAQLATDLRRFPSFPDGQACVAGTWLAANGRVQALGSLLRMAPDRYWWVLHEALVAALRANLQRFVLRSRLALGLRDDLVLASSATPESAEVAATWRDPAGRLLRLLPRSAAPADVDPGFGYSAIARGWLDFGPQHADRYLPQMLGLQRFAAIALDKGCYPGQEIVARSHYLGRIKRALKRFVLERPPESAELVDAQGEIVGEWLTATVGPDARHHALAVVAERATECQARFADGELLVLQAQPVTESDGA